jgi:hypothetical protein
MKIPFGNAVEGFLTRLVVSPGVLHTNTIDPSNKINNYENNNNAL